MPVREKSGKLFFDFFFRGIRCKEYTGLVDTAENRRYCEQKLRVVERDIARGSFDYRHHFPRGSRLHLFHPEDRMRDGAIATFADYVERWQRMRSPLLPDGGLVKDAELHPSTWLHDRTIIQRHLIPAFGPLRLCEIDVVRCNGFRRSLIDAGLSGKSVGNVAGLLHKVFADAVEEGLIDHNPVLRASSRRLRMSRRHRLTADPLSPDEIARFLAVVSDWYRDFYTVWFQVGWRSSEIVALRFGWLDFERQTVIIKRGRIPRLGGLEAEPKTGPREVQCGYAPEVFAAFQRLRERAQAAGPEDYVFTSRHGLPLSQEWLNEAVWKPTLRRAEIRERGQYCIRDTFITIALSSGEDPGWVAQVCGTSEQMIFRHYRHWIPALQTGAGSKVNGIIGKLFRRQDRDLLSLKVSPSVREERKPQQSQRYFVVREGGLEPPRACAHKVLSLARLPFRHSRA